MGGKVVRMFRNFNLENRALREIAKEKPRPAPRHEHSVPAPDVVKQNELKQKDDPLLTLLRSVYVESTDPENLSQPPKQVTLSKETGRRQLKYSLPVQVYGLAELTDVPKGKLTIIEALKATSSHQRQPLTWTPEKIAQEYSLDLKDTKDLLEFFIPFEFKRIPPKNDNAKRLKASDY